MDILLLTFFLRIPKIDPSKWVWIYQEVFPYFCCYYVIFIWSCKDFSKFHIFIEMTLPTLCRVFSMNSQVEWETSFQTIIAVFCSLVIVTRHILVYYKLWLFFVILFVTSKLMVLIPSFKKGKKKTGSHPAFIGFIYTITHISRLNQWSAASSL